MNPGLDGSDQDEPDCERKYLHSAANPKTCTPTLTNNGIHDPPQLHYELNTDPTTTCRQPQVMYEEFEVVGHVMQICSRHLLEFPRSCKFNFATIFIRKSTT